MNSNRGFTLVEMLVAIGIFFMLGGAMIGFVTYAWRGRLVVLEALSTQNEGRRIVRDFTNELRSATQSSVGAYSLEKATGQEIIFYSNIDTDSWRERVRYFLSATSTLRKGITKPSGSPLRYATSTTEVITDMVHDVDVGTSSLFYYYGENYTGANSTATLSYPIDLTKVRMVEIRLILEENPNLSPAPLYISGKAQIRNLKTN